MRIIPVTSSAPVTDGRAEDALPNERGIPLKQALIQLTENQEKESAEDEHRPMAMSSEKHLESEVYKPSEHKEDGSFTYRVPCHFGPP